MFGLCLFFWLDRRWTVLVFVSRQPKEGSLSSDLINPGTSPALPVCLYLVANPCFLVFLAQTRTYTISLQNVSASMLQRAVMKRDSLCRIISSKQTERMISVSAGVWRSIVSSLSTSALHRHLRLPFSHLHNEKPFFFAASACMYSVHYTHSACMIQFRQVSSLYTCLPGTNAASSCYVWLKKAADSSRKSFTGSYLPLIISFTQLVVAARFWLARCTQTCF